MPQDKGASSRIRVPFSLKQHPTPGLLVLELELLLADLRETKRLLLQLDRQSAIKHERANTASGDFGAWG